MAASGKLVNMGELSRIKPDRFPALHPVPEYAARGELKDIYERTKQGLSVPWMGVVAMAFAHYPNFYKALWDALEPVVGQQQFHTACDTLRTCAEKNAAKLTPFDILPILERTGYDPREIAEIRACNEVFSQGNMPYVLMATLARYLLEDNPWNGDPIAQDATTPRAHHAKPVLVELHHADQTVADLYSDIKETLGLPFVNTDYRAFARWPSYFIPAWADLKRAVESDDYETRVTEVHDTAIRLVQALPNPLDLTSARLKHAASTDATLEEVQNVVRLFQWLLPGLAVNVAILRAQLDA